MSSSAEPQPRDRLIRRLLNRRKPKAREYIDDPAKLGEFIDRVGKKVDEQAGSKGPLDEVWDYLNLLLRMVKSYRRREYTDVAVGPLVLIVAALIYFLNPLDLLPDAILLAGFIDDAAVLAFVVKQVRSVLDRYRAWESAGSRAGGL